MKPLFAICLICLLGACTEEFYPDTTNYENLLVVDGLVTNEPGPYRVELSRSLKFGETQTKPVKGARVTILSSDGEVATCTEVDDGVYQTDSTGFRGKIGNAYKLQIEIIEGEVYQSTSELLAPPITIETIQWDFAEGPDGETGVSFFVSTPETDSVQYLRWEYEEFWEVVPMYFQDTVPRLNYGKQPDKDYYPDFCYTQAKSNNINIQSTEDYFENQVVNHEITLITPHTTRLLRRYMIKAKQFSMSAGQYKFWKTLAYYNKDEGGLYDSYPSPVKGNITNRNNSNESVLGGFFVSAVSRATAAITNREIAFKIPFIQNAYICIGITATVDSAYKNYHPDTLEAYEQKVRSLQYQIDRFTGSEADKQILLDTYYYYNYFAEIYKSIKETVEGFTVMEVNCADLICNLFLVPNRYCFDCREFASENKPPDWDSYFHD